MKTADRKRHRPFTLLEVMVAAIILAMGTAMTFAIIGTARGQILKAQRQWARAHVLSQAAEFYLLAGPAANPPNGMLPQGFTARCDVRLAEGLPEHAADALQDWPKWRLGVYTISVTNSFGDVVGTWTIEKIVNEEDAF